MSIIKDNYDNECYMCGKYGRVEVHHIFEGCTRSVCDRDRLTVNLCRSCHDKVHSSKGQGMREYLHRIGQEAYEEEIGSREDFIRDYIKSYL